MARPLRITYPGAFYHITLRGNERKAIFKRRTDRRLDKRKVEDAALKQVMAKVDRAISVSSV